MPKYHKIRWNDADSKELERVVRNFNSKINRLSKKNPEMKNALPDKVTVRQLKELINTRQDLKRELNSLKRFSKRGSEEIIIVPDTEYNLKTTKWQKNEISRRLAVINRKRQERLKQMQDVEMKSRGESLGYTRGQLGMGRQMELSFLPLNGFTRYMNQKDLKWKWKTILAESQSDYYTKRDFQLRENYIKSLKENYRENDIKGVIEIIEKMDIHDFLQTFQEEGGTFEFSYPPDEEQYNAYLSGVKATWEKVKNKIKKLKG